MSKAIECRVYEAVVERGLTLTFRPIARDAAAGVKRDEVYKMEISCGDRVVEMHVKDWELLPQGYLEEMLWQLLNGKVENGG